MSNQFKETAENLNVAADVQDNLSPAEQAAAEAIVEYWTPLDGEPDLTIEDVADEARAIVTAVRPYLAPAGFHDGVHHYLSTGCLHGDTVLPDGRTGHQYCQGHTGNAGQKRPASCKFCAAPCRCSCHQNTEQETTR